MRRLLLHMTQYVVFFVGIAGFLLAGCFSEASADTKTWTDTPDWASASDFKNITWTDVQGQIQLVKNPPKSRQTPFIYIPNSDDNTIAQLDTKTGKINWIFDLKKLNGNQLGQYSWQPSRTTVDANGHVWFGMRFQVRGGKAVDYANEVVWLSMQGKLLKVVKTGSCPRAITVDLQGNVWVGNWKDNSVVKLDGKTGNELKRISNIACPYGAVADIHNNIWVVNNCKWDNSNTITKLSQEGRILGRYPAPGAYGIATDTNGQVWVSNWPGGCLHRFSNNGQSQGCIRMNANPRGVAVDGNGNIWVPCSHSGSSEISMIVKLSSSGQILGRFTDVGKHTIGVAVDADGFIWAVSYRQNLAAKIRSSDGVTVGKYPTGGRGPYTYSDMTGFAFQSLANPAQGYWRSTHASKCVSTWQKITWNGSAPQGTSITVRARTGATKAALATAQWSPPLSNGSKPPVPDNLWIEVEVSMRTFDAQITPYVQDVTVVSQPGGKEICNGKDDNCNGIIDEGPDGKPLTRTCTTRCGTGIAPCVSGDWSTCSAKQATPEVCNGIDDDCDGKTDNGAQCGASGVCTGGACLRSCTSECPGGQRCTNGFCVGTKPCSEVTCETGKTCKNGICMSPCQGVVCPKDKPYVCVDGLCVQDDCYSKGCPAGQICKNGTCSANACANVNCPADQQCKNGVCQNTCASQNCAAGQSCQNGQCQSDPCAGISCGAGEVCNFGKCQSDPCQGQNCRPGQVCSRGQCIDDPCKGVRCPVGQECRPPYGDCFGNGPGPSKPQDFGAQPDGGTIPTSPIDGGTSNGTFDGGGSNGTTGPRGDACVCSFNPNNRGMANFGLLALLIFFSFIGLRRRRR